MANANAPFGFEAVRHYAGGLVRSNFYRIASGLAANIYTGDLVKTTGTTKRVTVCTAGDRNVGVFRGTNYPASDGSIVFDKRWPTGTVTGGTVEAEAMVIDDPLVLFKAQYAGTLAETDIGQQADMLASTAGSATTGISGQQVDTVGQAGLKVIDYVRDSRNEVGQYAKVLVLINEHENGPTASTTAV